LSNPHYPPEIQAECTLINFTVTEAGLEDQLLTLVVKKERPDLAAEKERLIQQQNEFKITLKALEADLLHRLATAEGDILDNISLIENLEKSKKLSTEINEKVEIAKVTEIAINDASEAYRPSASRGALVFFLMTELTRIHSFYKYSLDSVIIVINRAIDKVAEAMNPKKEERPPLEEGEEAPEEPEEEEKEAEMTPRTLKFRVEKLTESITYECFNYVRAGALDRHKLIIATMLCFRICIKKNIISAKEVDSLVKKEVSMDEKHQSESLKFIPETSWGAVRGLESIKVFENLIQSMESEALQWRKWYSEEKAELVELPRAFKDASLFHRTLLLRAMRPDRLTGALNQFVSENLGIEYVEQKSFDIFQMYAETTPRTTVFFVLFPGVDPTPDVEKIGKANGKSLADGTFINISMGQGQEIIALEQLADAGKTGKWAMFQNVHLMEGWLKDFERKLEIVIEAGVHPEFRSFISSEPPPQPDTELIPESILQNAIKIANEAPQDLKSNLRRAFSKFDDEQFEKAKSHKLTEYKAILFGLCMYHSLIVGRKKFGS
jgi:dynein heavy chain